MRAALVSKAPTRPSAAPFQISPGLKPLEVCKGDLEVGPDAGEEPKADWSESAADNRVLCGAHATRAPHSYSTGSCFCDFSHSWFEPGSVSILHYVLTSYKQTPQDSGPVSFSALNHSFPFEVQKEASGF